MIAPFEASKLKLDRAREHLQEFESAVKAYLSEKPCIIVVESFRGLEQMGTQSWNASRIQISSRNRDNPKIGQQQTILG
jgi:hypothetical protein